MVSSEESMRASSRIKPEKTAAKMMADYNKPNSEQIQTEAVASIHMIRKLVNCSLVICNPILEVLASL